VSVVAGRRTGLGGALAGLIALVGLSVSVSLLAVWVRRPRRLLTMGKDKRTCVYVLLVLPGILLVAFVTAAALVSLAWIVSTILRLVTF
jgi:hypothetical protein